MSAGRRPLPRWIDLGVLPLVNLALALLVAGLIVLAIGANPLAGAAHPGQRRLRLSGGDRLHAVLRHHLRLHRPRGRGRLPRRPVQHRRRRPGLYRRARRRPGAARASTRRCPPLLLIALAIVAAARVRRRLGRGAGLPAGLSRQPHRHHHHHVQLHRLGADGLPAGQRADRARHDDAGEARVRRRRPPALRPRAARPSSASRWPSSPLNLDLPARSPPACSSGCSSGTRRGATRCARSATTRRPRAYAGISSRRVTILAMCLSGALAGLVGVNEIAGVHHRAAPELRRRRRLRRHRGRADGAQPSGRHRAGEPAVRRALPGRRRAGVRDPGDHRDMVVVLQGLVILFSGALANMPRAVVRAALSPCGRAGRAGDGGR